MRKPYWVDGNKYPFDSHTVNLSNHRFHYLDEGDGEPLVFLHGNPTWSFLFRHLIRDLRPRFRCIAPDWFGFGLSAKSSDLDYKPPFHADVLKQFLDELALDDFNLLVHDWGGPIGLSVAGQQPNRLGKLIVFNSWPGALEQYAVARLFSRLMASHAGTWISQSASLMPLLISLGTLNRFRFIKNAYSQYRGSHPDPEAICQLARSLTEQSEWLATVKRRARDSLADKPLMLLWGDRDPVLSRRLIDEWTDLFRNHRVNRIEQASHFVPEDIGHEYSDQIVSFLSNP